MTVRVIARGTLNDFVQNRVERKLQGAVKDQLDAWYAEAVEAKWRSSAELKAQYGRPALFRRNASYSTLKEMTIG
jgi:mRNA-degrading endonuclease HigB of HigAB toxin-antitoxin module